jgi:hypothetical protein
VCESTFAMFSFQSSDHTAKKTVSTGKHQPFLHISCNCSHHSSKFVLLQHYEHHDKVLYNLYSNSGYKTQNSYHAVAHYCKVILTTLVTVQHYNSSMLQCIYMLHSTNTSFHYVPTAQDTSLHHTNTALSVEIILNYTLGGGGEQKQNLIFIICWNICKLATNKLYKCIKNLTTNEGVQ